jgi:hypothetical protein
MLYPRRQLQPIVLKESDIKHFFEKYGPSARDCYEFCKANRLGSYEEEVRRKIKDLSTEILTSHPADIQTNDGSHKVLLVEPRPDDRALSRARIVTKTVGQLLWERDSGEIIANFSRLYFGKQAPEVSVGNSLNQPFMNYAFAAQRSQYTRWPAMKDHAITHS